MSEPGPRRRARRDTGTVEPVVRTCLDEEPFVQCVEARLPGLGLASWVATHRSELLEDLLRYGVVLFRGFAVDSPTVFGRVARAYGGDLLDYLERAAPRHEVVEKVFTSTEFASDQWIPLHHEMSYSHNWPSRLYFYCESPAAQGGATPVASERRFFPRLPAEIRDRFMAGGVRYVRNYGGGLDLSWQEVFQTTDRAVVEAYCRDSATEFVWTGGDGLRTTAVRQATVRHPATGETVWFNHAHLFHFSNMPAEISSMLVSEFGYDGLPRNAYYGDGAPIETDVIHVIGDLYRDCAVSFPWQKGDVLVVDNFLAAHGRAPFTGERRTLVAMSDLYVNSAARGA